MDTSTFGLLALKAVFGAKWKTAFQHTDNPDHHGHGSRKRKAMFSSATVERHRRQKPRLAFLADERG